MVDANWRVLYVVISFNCLNSYHDVHLCLRWSSMSDFDGWHEHHKVSNHSWRIIRVLFFQDRLLRSLAGRFAPKARLVMKIFVNMFRKLLLRSSKPPLKFKPPQVCIFWLKYHYIWYVNDCEIWIFNNTLAIVADWHHHCMIAI